MLPLAEHIGISLIFLYISLASIWLPVGLLLAGIILLMLLYQQIKKRLINDADQQLKVLLRDKLREVAIKNQEILQQSELLQLEKDRAENINEALELTLQQVQAKNEEIAHINEKVASGLRYARRIQKATFPPYTWFKSIFEDSFILYKPLDMVSGDLYWMHTTPNEISLAVMDCTGHGVSAAFMGLIGHGHLNAAIQSSVPLSPGYTLTMVDHAITNQLKHETTGLDVPDGIEMLLLSFTPDLSQLYFAGAHRPLYLVRVGELLEFKGKNYSVAGNKLLKGSKDFDTLHVPIQSGDMLYLSTDGFSGQLGGPNHTTFKSRHLKTLLTEIAHLPVNAQKIKLKEALSAWKNNGAQTDDILIIGIRIP